MFPVLLLTLALVSAAVAEQCSGGNLVPHGQPCECHDFCLGNSKCQHDGQGGFACLCRLCQYFDTQYKQCLDIPGFGEACTTTCSSGFECLADGSGGYRCQCPPSLEYDSATGKCVYAPDYGESCTDLCRGDLECRESEEGGKTCQCKDNLLYNPNTNKCDVACIRENAKNCDGLPNGDYPACFPRCKKGIYITCSNGYIYVRDCALGWYVKPNGDRFTEKMVYHPDLKRCERSASYCPRVQDNWVEE